jgi:hypothetical protein
MESTQKTRRDLQAVVAHIHRDVVHDEVDVSMLDIQEVVRSLKEAGATREEADDLLNGVAQEIEDSATELTAAANELRIETDAALDEVFPEGDDHDDSDAALNVDIDHDDIEGTVTKMKEAGATREDVEELLAGVADEWEQKAAALRDKLDDALNEAFGEEEAD